LQINVILVNLKIFLEVNGISFPIVMVRKF